MARTRVGPTQHRLPVEPHPPNLLMSQGLLTQAQGGIKAATNVRGPDKEPRPARKSPSTDSQLNSIFPTSDLLLSRAHPSTRPRNLRQDQAGRQENPIANRLGGDSNTLQPSSNGVLKLKPPTGMQRLTLEKLYVTPSRRNEGLIGPRSPNSACSLNLAVLVDAVVAPLSGCHVNPMASSASLAAPSIGLIDPMSSSLPQIVRSSR